MFADELSQLLPHKRLRYIELDFPETVTRKLRVYSRRKELSSLLPTSSATSTSGEDLVTDEYCLLPADLRFPAQVEAALFTKAQLDPAAPTLFLSECVVVYMQPDDGDQLIRSA